MRKIKLKEKTMKINKDIPFGNLCSYSVNNETSPAVVEFAADPHGGPESMWFCFRLEKTEESEKRKVRLVFKFFQNVLGGGGKDGSVSIVARKGTCGWERLGLGKRQISADGQVSLIWDLDFASEYMDFALCYPYGKDDIEMLLKKSEGYWKSDSIGVSQGGREIMRLSNSYGSAEEKKPGIYLIARQHSGETPGSWGLHGFLDYFAKSGNKDFLIWSVPLSNIDGVMNGDYGKDNFPYDLNRAWGSPPMRHETKVIKTDMNRWAGRCKPFLSLDFHAPGICEFSGIYSFVARNLKKERDKASSELSQTIHEKLKGMDLASQEFILRSTDYKSRWETPHFTEFSLNDMNLISLSFEFSYSFAGKKELQREDYMAAGTAIAESIVEKYS